MSYWSAPERPLEPPEDRRKVCYTCSCCGDEIREGDDYYDLRLAGLGVICEACIEDAHHYDAEVED